MEFLEGKGVQNKKSSMGGGGGGVGMFSGTVQCQ